MPALCDHDNVDVVITLDRDTIARLLNLARVAGEHPCETAAALLRDLLIDDELAHAQDRPVLLHS